MKVRMGSLKKGLQPSASFIQAVEKTSERKRCCASFPPKPSAQARPLVSFKALTRDNWIPTYQLIHASVVALHHFHIVK